jgi:hypothetical protein
MAEKQTDTSRKRRHFEEEEEDEEDEADSRRQCNRKRAVKDAERLCATYCDDTVVTRFADMTVSWYNGFRERIFKNVKLLTNFGAQIAVGYFDGSWEIFKNINDETPLRRVDIAPDGLVCLSVCIPAFIFHTLTFLLHLVILNIQVGFMQIGEMEIRFMMMQEPGTVMLLCGQIQTTVPSDARFELYGTCILAWTIVYAKGIGPVARCTSIDLATGNIQHIFSNSPLPNLPSVIMPRSNQATVLFFGANPVEISLHGSVVNRDDIAFVGKDDHVIYTLGREPFDRSPLGNEVTWMQGVPGIFISLLTASGRSMFLTAA